ncbi:MAG: peptide chain release factor-like protein [Coriobacteriaceae bacterium]|nr:peptide chain release factor-like protein [Coriobacteriaceae bacterium]
MDEAPISVPETDEALLGECDVSTFRATGPGGQSVNTTDSAVRLRHRPTGVTVVCRRERSQHMNKSECLRRLRAKLEALAAPPPPPRVATRKPRGVRAGELEDKTRRARVKRLRKPPAPSEE